MMKKITSTLIILFIMLFTINVKAGDYYNIISTIEKSEDSGELYNLMPTEVKRGDIVSVSIAINNASGWKVSYGYSTIGWDKEAFELVETNGKYYTNKNINVEEFNLEFVGDNKVQINYSFGDTQTSNKVYVVDLKFKAKKNVKDGIYKIYQEFTDHSIMVDLGNDQMDELPNYAQELKYQIGNVKVTSNYTKEDIENMFKNRDVYIIGNHMFTRDKIPNVYGGSLLTEYIMLAAKSIESNNKDDMIIYLKDVFDGWKNAINDKNINVPESFKITYINTQANYLANGLYTDNNEKTILRIVQINEKEAIVTIEDVGERVHGIANMNGNVATLTASGKEYQITIGDNTVAITTTDSYITNKNLTKRTNVSINDYFNNNYADGVYDGYGGATHYVNSSVSGEYSYGNYGLTVLRVSNSSARICLREKNDTECLIDGYAISPSDDGKYYLQLDEISYEISYDDEKITIGCETGTCNSEYYGTYNKDKSITMEDAFHIWEKNEVGLKVVFDPNSGSDSLPLYVAPGQTVMSNPDWEAYYEYHNKDGVVFDKWVLNGEEFDFDTPITEPITLVATYKELPGAPTLVIAPQGTGHDYYHYEDDLFYYHLSIELDDAYDGYDVFEISGDSEISVTEKDGDTYTVAIDTNATKQYIARAYVMGDGKKQPGQDSNVLNIHPVKYTVSFDSKGGSQVPSQIIPYGKFATEPDENNVPLKTGFTFVEWQLDGEPFDFENTPINSNITLTAIWENNITRPVISRENIDSIYHFRLSLGNHNDYCSNLSGTCTKDSNDNYWITGYEIYEIVENMPQVISLGAVTQFKPYESIEMTMEPNTTKRFVMKAYIKEGAVVTYSNDSAVLEIDTTIATPTIAFNPNGGEPDSTKEVENWIDVTNLNDAFTWTGGYTVNGFELANKVGDNYQSIATYGPQDLIYVTANYGDVRHYAIRAFAYDTQGEPKYGDYSNILDLDTTAPATPACYVDGDDEYHWTTTPNTGWTEVTGISSETDCHATVEYACYIDGDDEYHWTTTPETEWNEVTGVSSETDCHATVEYGCYIDQSTFEYHWTNEPQDGWVLFPGITNEATCA